MTKTEQLQKLFAGWKKEIDLFSSEAFFEDGIINEDLWQANKPGKKVLFIAKEPNAKDRKGGGSFVEEWDVETPPTYNFAHRLSEWAYGIMNDFPPYEQIENKLSYLRQIAFMNVKKSGGGGFTDNKEMYRIVKPQCPFIIREVNIIEADIIVACLSFAEGLLEDIFGKVQFISSGYNVKIGRYNNSRIINFYHPSSRNVPVAMYSLLQNVVQSEAFQNL